MRILVLLTGILFITALFLACARQAFPVERQSPSKSGSQENLTSGKASWQVEWEKTLAEAKREGSVVVYTTAGSEVRTELTRAFKEKYGLEVEFIVGRGEGLAQKIFTERRAGLYLADAYMAGVTTQLNTLKPAGILDRMEPYLVLPEVIDQGKWLSSKLPFIDKDHVIIGFRSSPSIPLEINTALVREDEIKSYKNLLEARWKGKIVMQDPTMAGTTQTLLAMIGLKLMNWDFIRDLAKQEPVLLRDDRLLTEWVARGKYPIGMGLKKDVIKEFRKAGAPIMGLIPVEGTFMTSGSGSIALVNRPAHPGATRLFINWLLSKEGQTIYSRANMTASARIDVPKDHLPPEEYLDPNRRYVLEDEAFYLSKPEFERIFLENFSHLAPK